MTALVRTELLKLVTTRTVWAFSAAAVALTLAMLGSTLLNAGRIGAPSLGTTAGTLGILAASGLSSILVLLLGVVGITGEFRYSTATSTFLVTPARERVIAAKVAAYAIAGAMAAPFLLLLSGGIGLATGALDPAVINSDIALTLLGVLLTLPLYAILGVGLGSVIRNQAAAIAIALIWFFVVETLLPAYGQQWLLPLTPKGAAAALTRDPNLIGALPQWAGGLLFAAYGLALAAIGGARIARSDLT